jgi:hypothetical protein
LVRRTPCAALLKVIDLESLPVLVIEGFLDRKPEEVPVLGSDVPKEDGNDNDNDNDKDNVTF